MENQVTKKHGGLMNMLIHKHKLEKIMLKARDQMTLNELNIRAEVFCLYRMCLSVVLSPFFQSFITFCIVGNMIVLSIDRYPISEEETRILESLNLAFFLVFFLEMLLKFLGLGFR
mmetsp:Transcript_34047/g.33219  ORF Transcript_34047/g.33219 Transcript_34047/m.33219 type:complete len:116 (+) Transcript_34047:1298-1645(+)